MRRRGASIILIILLTYGIPAVVFGAYQFFDPIIENRPDSYVVADKPATFKMRLLAAVFVAVIWPVILYAVLTRGW